MDADNLDDIMLLTDSNNSCTYDSDIEDVRFGLKAANPFASPELLLRAVDPAGSTLSVDRFSAGFFSDTVARTRATRRTASTLTRALGRDVAPEAVDRVLDRIAEDLARGQVVVLDKPTKSTLEDVSRVVYTPGSDRPWTIVKGRERFDRRSKSFARSLVRYSPEVMGLNADPPNNPPNPSLTQNPDRWQAFASVCTSIAEDGEVPKRRESLDVTDPEHIDRLPSNVLCGLSHGELTELVKECNRRKGGPESLEGTLRIEHPHGQPSKPVLGEFIEKNGLTDELDDISPKPA